MGVEFAKNEVRFEDLSIEADVYVGNRSMPTLPNSFRNLAEVQIACTMYIRFSA